MCVSKKNERQQNEISLEIRKNVDLNILGQDLKNILLSFWKDTP